MNENGVELLLSRMSRALERKRERLPGLSRFHPDSTRLVGGDSGRVLMELGSGSTRKLQMIKA